MASETLKQLSWTVKLLAIVIALIELIMFFAVERKPISNIAVAGEIIALALAVAPNRWFVSSRTVFIATEIVALFPLRSLLDPSSYRGIEFHVIIGIWLAVFFLFGFLPLSLLLSRTRFNRGEKVFYA